MTLMLGAEALEGVIDMREAIDLLDRMSRQEAAGCTLVSPRLNTAFEGGWMRMMFAADCAAGYAATKAFHMVQGVGVRYVVSLYRLADGELIALLDGRLITDLRTGAASGVVARRMRFSAPVSVGLIGAGHQARMQLECLASVCDVTSASVYSPTRENRERYAREMSAKLGIEVSAAASAEQAARGRHIVVAATSSQAAEPVLRGEWLNECRLLCAVGSTRPQSIEVDVQCFSGAALVVVDTLRAAEEAGDLAQAVKSGALAPERQATLAQLASAVMPLPEKGRVAFKSVGTALQDLALATRYYEVLAARGDSPHVPGLASLKQPVSLNRNAAKRERNESRS